MKPEQRTIRVRSFDAYEEVQAAVYGGVLALHRLHPTQDKWGWTVTHIPTGATVYNPQLQREGKGFILAALEAGQGWDWHNLTRENMEALRDIIQRKPATCSSSVRALGDLCIDWLPGFTPSESLQALARRCNRAWHSEDDAEFKLAAEEVTQQEWYELIMTRMATGKRATLLASDVPLRAPTLNGVSCDLAGFKCLFRELWQIGTDIEDIAGRMQGLIAVGEPDGRDEDQWIALDKELSGKIQEGWMKWSSAVYVFATLPLPQQSPFLQRLGFLGSTEKGWHALGKKSFLRSTALSTVLPVRREIRRRNGNYGE